jgi:hypothetical protein
MPQGWWLSRNRSGEEPSYCALDNKPTTSTPSTGRDILCVCINTLLLVTCVNKCAGVKVDELLFQKISRTFHRILFDTKRCVYPSVVQCIVEFLFCAAFVSMVIRM